MKTNIYVLVWAIWLFATILVAIPKWETQENKLIQLQELHQEQQQKIDKIYKQANKRTLPYKQEQKQIEKKADELRQQLFSKNVDFSRANELIEQMFVRTEKIYGVPYKLWGKTKETIDCSWLFTLYGEEIGLVSEWYKIHVGNAYNLFTKKTAPVENPSRWDVLYLRPQTWWINHIALIHHVAYEFEKEMWLVVVDASYGNWVQKRNLVITKTKAGNKYSIEWTVYDAYFASNPILAFEREQALSTPKKEVLQEKEKTNKKETVVKKW
jgi:hypothetical protein